MPSARRIAQAILRQASEMEDAANAIFNPDRGRAPQIYMDYASPVSRRTERAKDGAILVSATIRYGQNGRDGGVYASSPYFKTFMEKFHQDRVLQDAFREALDKELPRISAEWSKRASEILLKAVYGYKDADEFETPTDIAAGLQPAGFPVLRAFGEMRQMVDVLVTFKTKRKEALLEGPFSTMPDRELNEWIETWASIDPEGFWQDGELKMTRAQAYAAYRRQWRSLPPRAQVEKLEWLKRHQ